MKLITSLLAIICFAISLPAQIPINTGVQILKAEDARRYDAFLENLMKSPNAELRERAALAAGRIGREEAIPSLAALLTNDPSEKVRVMAAFALGEIESIRAADIVQETLRWYLGEENVRLDLLANIMRFGKVPSVRARLVEAAGKIVAANANSPQVKALQISIFDQLNAQAAMGIRRDYSITLLGLTAALRAKPVGVDVVVAKFLSDPDARIRVDALNTLARLRSKQSLPEIRSLLERDADGTVRANAARVLGAAEDKDALELLLNAATTDKDSRVRVAAIRSLGSLKDMRAVERLEEYQAALLEQAFRRDEKRLGKTGYYRIVPEQNELLELITALGNILAATKPTSSENKVGRSTIFEKASPSFTVPLLNAPETSIARAKIDPGFFMFGFLERFRSAPSPLFNDWRAASSVAQGLGVVAALTKEKYGDSLPKNRSEAQEILRIILADKKLSPMALPDVLTAYAAFKPADLSEVLLRNLNHDDPMVRAAVAGLLAEIPTSKANIEALKSAFAKAFIRDKSDNDAQLAILDALYKLDKKESVGVLLTALNAPDYLVRKKAFDLLADKDLQKDFPGIQTSLESARTKRTDQVQQYSPISGTRLGQILNTDADYHRALSRKNNSVKAVLKTEKGTFTINFYPEEAPLTVDNFIKLARSGYFNGLEVHRVVPNFVMQDGDPRGDGNGGPGWSIRCEINTLPYYRGVVGMALSGKDTGGSQWFVTHSPQPHLDGGYTVFGRVSETDMKVVDNIVRGDKILSVKIVEANLPQRTQRKK